MAKSKGISDRRILWRHALRPSSLTLLTVAGLNVGALIGGAVVIEVIFHLHGMGSRSSTRSTAASTSRCRTSSRSIAIVLRARELRGRRPLPRARPEDPRCSNRLTPARRRPAPARRRPSRSKSRRTRSSRKRAASACWRGSAIGWLAFIVLGRDRSAPLLPIKDPIDGTTTCTPRPGMFTPGPPARQRRHRPRRAQPRDLGRAGLAAVALGAVAFGTLIGGFLGLLAGFKGGRTDTVLSALFNIFLAFPQLVLALTLVSVLAPVEPAGGAAAGECGHRIVVVILALGIVSIPILGRITRASTLAWSQREFVLAARAQGATDRRIMFREVLPNVLPAMFSIALLGIAVVIVAEGALAILGVERPAPDAVVGQHDRTRSRATSDSAPHACGRAVGADLPHRARRSTSSATSCARASTCGRARCEPAQARQPRRRSGSPTRRSTARCSRSTTSRRSSRPTAGSCTRSTASRSRSSGARRSASSASRARASRCSRARSWACCPSNVVRARQHPVRGPRDRQRRHRGDAPATGARRWRWCSRTR